MTGGDGARTLAVADVLAAVVTRGDRSAWPAALVAECAASLGVAGVGVAVADDGGPVAILAATAGAGQAGEDLQFALGEGPCRTAAESGLVVHAPDLSRDDRWVQFGRSAADAGIVAASSVPLQVGAVLVGVLDVYRDTLGPLSEESARRLAVYARAAVAVLLLLDDPDVGGADPARLADMADLADIRPVVHQAAGMIAVQLEVDLAVALLRLRAHAFGTGRSLRDLAGDVVARRIRFDVPTDDLDHPDDDPSALQERNPDEHP